LQILLVKNKTFEALEVKEPIKDAIIDLSKQYLIFTIIA
jgi:hypothetical protein